MVLQKILFPNKNVCSSESLYFRLPKGAICQNLYEKLGNVLKEQKKKIELSEEADIPADIFNKYERYQKIFDIYTDEDRTDGIVLNALGQKLRLDTYFNSFSVFKWKKYTNIDNLSLSLELMGDFRIDVKNVIRLATENEVVTLDSYELHEEDRNTVDIEIPFDKCDTGLVYVEITTLSDVPCVIFGGEYHSSVEADVAAEVKIAIAMCTYKREKYVESNIEALKTFLIDNEDSTLKGNLELYIADNSKTLDIDRLSDEAIHIFPNKNLGGAGGFGRDMYEILMEKDKKRFTNIIMMDDDVKFDPNVFERLYAFLSLLKETYKEAHIGGAMLELDNEWLQSESGEYWYPLGHRAVKYRYDLRDIKWLLKNEIEDSVDNFGWWFCCMPISVVREDNLPMPVFIKRDDIEYGLRNGRLFINLNGISVWHEAFDAKRTPFLDYYYYRNPLILNARHCESFDLMSMLDYYDNLRRKIDEDVNLYRYKEAHLKIKGVDDFLKGIDWFKAQDAEALNQTILKRWTYVENYIEDMNNIFVHGVLEKTFKFTETKKQEEARIKSNNGWDVPPTKGKVLAPLRNPDPGFISGSTKVVYYDEITQKGYITFRSYAQRDAVYKHYEMTRQNIIENFERVRKEYNERFEELISIDFWKEYLFSDKKNKSFPKEWWENVADFSEKRIADANNRLEQYKLEMREQEKRIKDYPIVNNRVVFYLFRRRGFTCNVKYILQELVKEAGDKLEIIWVTDYPETCDKVRDLGIEVVKAGTKKHWEYYFTARVNITSDCQPPYFIKRDDQVAITAWHGGISYKVIGYDCLGPSTDAEIEIYGLQNKQPDYWLSGSKRFTDDTAGGFRHDKKTFLSTGMARNDLFFSDTSQLVKKLKKDLGIKSDKKVALYAPTFRRGGKAAQSTFDLDSFRAALSERFGGEWEILYRGHYFIKNNPRLSAIDVSQYEDMQELLCLSDVLISDYSSCMWDFTFTGRPIFIYAPDLDEYVYNDRGFYIPVEEWPYPIASDSKTLYENVINFDEEDFKKKITAHHNKEGSFEKGSSAEAACKLIRDACGV